MRLRIPYLEIRNERPLVFVALMYFEWVLIFGAQRSTKCCTTGAPNQLPSGVPSRPRKKHAFSPTRRKTWVSCSRACSCTFGDSSKALGLSVAPGRFLSAAVPSNGLLLHLGGGLRALCTDLILPSNSTRYLCTMLNTRSLAASSPIVPMPI